MSTEILDKIDTTVIKIKKLDNLRELSLPFYATPLSVGMDLMAAIEEDITLEAGNVTLVPTGIAIELEEGYEAQIRPRSGLALKEMVTVLNTPGTIDADYRGEIKVILINHNTKPFVITRGMRIAQMVINKYTKATFEITDVLGDTDRSSGGFGSTGTK